ncbi:MAG: hypothetical protein HYU41_10260 [Candidatus Rokubacteria bacterium]|nr:hypothetical protein [Candidatus Rokubacteria bacterium]
MPVQTAIQERSTRRRTTERARRAAAVTTTTDDLEEREEPVAPVVTSSRSLPRIATVYRGVASGELHHARCARELTFVGVRGGIEIDFYCLNCREHVTLTEFAMSRVPVGQG